MSHIVLGENGEVIAVDGNPVPVRVVDAEYYTILNIAMVKAWNYCMEYDPTSGREVEKLGSNFLKEGYIEGFLAGFAHKFGDSDGENN